MLLLFNSKPGQVDSTGYQTGIILWKTIIKYPPKHRFPIRIICIDNLRLLSASLNDLDKLNDRSMMIGYKTPIGLLCR